MTAVAAIAGAAMDTLACSDSDGAAIVAVAAMAGALMDTLTKAHQPVTFAGSKVVGVTHQPGAVISSPNQLRYRPTPQQSCRSPRTTPTTPLQHLLGQGRNSMCLLSRCSCSAVSGYTNSPHPSR